MSSFEWIVVVASVGVCAIRWMRVSQREHYLPWAIIGTARRWASSRPYNGLLLASSAAATVGAAIALFLELAPVARVLGLLGTFLLVIFPLGMPLIGHPRFRLTRRSLFQLVAFIMLVSNLLLLLTLSGLERFLVVIVPGFSLVAVDLAALINGPLENQIARRFRRRAVKRLDVVRPRVIAITGSFGKTTVKNHVRDLLSSSWETIATPASWNNAAGVSRAINEYLTKSADIFIAEVGTYGPGEIKRMVSWLRPEIVAITAIGPVHLERMGTMGTIVKAKSEILEGAKRAVISIDSDLLSDLAVRTVAESRLEKVLTATSDSSRLNADVRASIISNDGMLQLISVEFEGVEIARVERQQLHPTNVAVAVAIALLAGVERSDIALAIGRLSSSKSRSTVTSTEGGVRVIDDTFNSNPQGAAAALEELVRQAPSNRRVVITPGMVELGELQDLCNTMFARAISAAECELVVVGWTNRKALLAGFPGARLMSDRRAARNWVRASLGSGDCVLWENDLPDHYP